MSPTLILVLGIVVVAFIGFLWLVASRLNKAALHPVAASNGPSGWSMFGFVGLLSFSLDLTGLMDYASTIFNSLSPIVVIIGGIILGLGLLGMVLTMITRAVKLHG